MSGASPSTHQPGDTWLHRRSAVAEMLGCWSPASVVVVMDGPSAVAGDLVLALAAVASARMG